MPTTTFRPFSRLPLELRNRIWNVSAIEPRVLTIQGVPTAQHLETEYFISPSPPPSTLQVCRESRFEAIKFYAKALRHGYSPRCIWTNFSADTIRIDDFRACKLLAGDAALTRQWVVESSDADLFNWYYAYHFLR
ncbi:hypothetical protein B0J14DRAFT_327118 [Halenospora varia]|nr:hypothetical protein B0J14DRAFT_327118 [Halenospora varia]